MNLLLKLLLKHEKQKGVKEIIYKIFAECALCINDPFWIEKFNLAAVGKLPSKFTYHDGMLTYRKGAKYITLEVSNNRAEAAYACMDFFRSHGGIFSPMDEQNSLAFQYERANSAINQEKMSWEMLIRKPRNLYCVILLIL